MPVAARPSGLLCVVSHCSADGTRLGASSHAVGATAADSARSLSSFSIPQWLRVKGSASEAERSGVRAGEHAKQRPFAGHGVEDEATSRAGWIRSAVGIASVNIATVYAMTHGLL